MIEEGILEFKCAKCKLLLSITNQGHLKKPEEPNVAKEIARTASDRFSRRELARLSDTGGTVRLVSRSQIPSSVEVVVNNPSEVVSIGTPVVDEVAAHLADCDGADTVNDSVQVESCDLAAKLVTGRINIAIAKKAVLHDRFKLIEQIGLGSNGRVVRGLDLATQQDVAIKIHFNTVGDSESVLELCKRVSRAFELQGKILSPYSVRPIALLVEDFGLVSVEEFVEGQNLKQAVQSKGAFSEVEAIHIGLQLCSVLQVAHDVLKIVHRDIKPENIVIQSDGTIKLLDYGCSRSNAEDKRDGGGVSLDVIEELVTINTETETLSIAGLIIGTPDYMSPEQVDGQRVTIMSDLCSVGGTLFYLATGQKPFHGKNLGELFKAVLYRKPPHPNDLLPEGSPKLTKRFCKVLKKAMEKSPEKRYKTPEEMKQALEACLSSEIKLKPTSFFTSFRNWLNGR